MQDLIIINNNLASASPYACLLYHSDAADDTPCVVLGVRRFMKKKTEIRTYYDYYYDSLEY